MRTRWKRSSRPDETCWPSNPARQRSRRRLRSSKLCISTPRSCLCTAGWSQPNSPGVSGATDGQRWSCRPMWRRPPSPLPTSTPWSTVASSAGWRSETGLRAYTSPRSRSPIRTNELAGPVEQKRAFMSCVRPSPGRSGRPLRFSDRAWTN